MICGIGSLVLYCAYGLHTIVHSLDTGRFEKNYSFSVVLCSTPQGKGLALYSNKETAQCPIYTLPVCHCEPFGAVANLVDEK